MADRVHVFSPIREFLRTEAGGGVLLLTATMPAFAWANSPWTGSYGATLGGIAVSAVPASTGEKATA